MYIYIYIYGQRIILKRILAEGPGVALKKKRKKLSKQKIS